MPLRLNVAASNGILTSGLGIFNGGTIKLYDGAQPDAGGGAVTTQTELGTASIPNPAFGTAANRGRGPASTWEVPIGAAASNDTVTWARLEGTGGEIVDLDVDDYSGSLILDTVVVSEFDLVRVTGGSIVLPSDDA
jgi:hypothetical protein